MHTAPSLAQQETAIRFSETAKVGKPPGTGGPVPSSPQALHISVAVSGVYTRGIH